MTVANEGRSATRIVDCTSAFVASGNRQRWDTPVSVITTEHTYLPDGEITQGWLPNVLQAFNRLAALNEERDCRIESYGSIGVGPGLDAIAVVEILGVHRLVLTDLHTDVVEIARNNVLANCPSLDPGHVNSFIGNICSGLRDRDIRVDLLYENLPNIPTADADIRMGVVAASFFDAASIAGIPPVYSDHMLGLHYRFLLEARQCLNRAGMVMCCIGGRVPVRIVEGMFDECGYEADVLNFAVVRQLEAESVLPAYANAEERGGVRFRFYPYEEAVTVLSKVREDGARTLHEVVADPRLQALALTATQASRLTHSIGHIGVVWRGCLRF